MTATAEAQQLAHTAADAAVDKLAEDVIAIDVSDRLALSDVFLIVSAPNERQVSAVVDEIEEKLRESGHQRLRREGYHGARWVLLDYGDVVVHVMHHEDRDFYSLERLWKDCPTLELGIQASAGGGEGE